MLRAVTFEMVKIPYHMNAAKLYVIDGSRQRNRE